MAIELIDLTKLQPTERQWVQNGVIGLDDMNKVSIMPVKTPQDNKAILKSWGKYVDTYTTKIYQMDIYECYAECRIGNEVLKLENKNGFKSSPSLFFKQVLYEKTLQGNVFIVLYNNSQLSFVNAFSKEETILPAPGINDEIQNIIYAFNRLIITTTATVLWSIPGLYTMDMKRSPDLHIIDGFKQSDTITQRYIGCYSDFKKLYLITKGGYEVWEPTQDSDNPFIYLTAYPGNVIDFDNEYCLMDTDEHRFGLRSVLDNEFYSDDRWLVVPEDITDMRVFHLQQTGNKVLAIYERSGAMWLFDFKYRLMTKITKAFYPDQPLVEPFQNMQINLLLDKGVYNSLYMQLGKFPAEIQFYIDNFYMKHAPLIAFERDDVIKTDNIGRLTVDTPLELNFKGYTAIYSLGLDKPSGR
jgi:hypothetical protein